MEAATPLRQQRVHVLMGRVLVENLVVDDPAAAAFVRARIEAGDDAVRVVNDAIEIGARVLEREQAGLDAEFVRNEFEKVSREVESAFTDKARVVAEFFGTKVDEVFGPENGHLARELRRLFGEESTAAVQHQLRQVMSEQSARMREDLLRQFSSADRSNPLADFKAAHLRAARDAVGDLRGLGGRKGDVVVDLDGCAGAPRGRIVFEAKNSRKSRKEALAELEEAMATRSADYGVWVVPSEDKLPARAPALREIGGDKLFVVYDPEDGARLALEVAYSLARARVLMARGDAEGLDALALRGEVDRALTAMDDVRRIKVQLTNAAGGIEEARRVLDGMAEGPGGRPGWVGPGGA